MLESIYVGMTGLLGYSRGLRVIANNTANINTPGFKSSSLQFADLFYTGGNLSGGIAGRGDAQLGFGLDTAGTSLSFRQGEMRQTGNELDLAVDGQGLFVVRGADGELGYTRAGQFKFDADGTLVTRNDGAQVLSVDAQGNYQPVRTTGRTTDAGQPTSRIRFSGNLSSTVSPQTVGGVQVVDAAGGSHTLGLAFTLADSADPGRWQVALKDGDTVVGTGQLVFQDGKPVSGSAVLSMSYAPAGLSPVAVDLDFGSDVTAFASGSLSTLAMASQDGVAPGTLTSAAFDAAGALVLRYSNGAIRTGARLALMRFDSPDAVASAGGNQFTAKDPAAWHLGHAGEGAFGKVESGVVEISNVDLSQEFSDLVVMQRGYQASSQIISTANDMLQELFSMKSK